MSAQAIADVAARGNFGALCNDLYRVMARYLPSVNSLNFGRANRA
jgi:hypothetical protein